MSGLELVGLFAGIPGLVQTCVHGYRTLVTAKNIAKDANILQTQTRIQEARLIRFAHSWGVVIGESTNDVSVAVRQVPQSLLGTMDVELAKIFSKLIKEILDQIATLLTDTAELTARYGLRADADDQDDSQLSSSRLTAFLKPIHRRRQSSPLRRLRWVVVDRNNFAELVDHLTTFNDALEQYVPSRQREDISLALPIQFAGVVDVVELEQLQAASQKYQLMQQVLDLKRYLIKVDDMASQASSGLGPLRKHLSMIEISNAEAQRPSGPRCRARYTDSGAFGSTTSNVLIEWKAFDDQSHTKRKEAIEERVASLAGLLNRASHSRYLNVLHCLGYFEDVHHSRFGYILAIPKEDSTPHASIKTISQRQSCPSGPSVEPHTLYSLLGQDKKASSVPDLGARFALALSLARTILQLHVAGWLHKGLRSDNIIFFVAHDETSEDAPDVSKPLLAGFEYSRPDTDMAITETLSTYSQTQDCYRHPATLSVMGAANPVTSRFRREFDVYSLGCILLEIGLWRRVDEFWKDAYKGNAGMFRDRLSKVWSKDLARTCGKTYEGVVQLCLSMGEAKQKAGRSDGAASERKDLDDYYYNVICKLQACSV